MKLLEGSMKLRSASMDEIIDEVQFVLGTNRGWRRRICLATVRRVFSITRKLALTILRATNRGHLQCVG
jgi:hypothetical protein